MYHANVNINLMVESVIQIKSRIMIIVNVSVKKKKKICEEDYNWNPATCSWEKDKYLANIIGYPVIRCYEIIDAETKTAPLNFNKKNINGETKSFHILLTILLISVVLLIAVSIYCYLIK